jgi:hypothetical protein
MEKYHNIELNCKGKCTKCDDGELLPFLKEVRTEGSDFGRGLVHSPLKTLINF